MMSKRKQTHKFPMWVKIGAGIAGLLGLAAGATFATRRGPQIAREMQSKTATNPGQLSLGDWKDALKETKAALGDKNLPMLAAGVAFFGVLAFFPTLAAFVAIFGLFASPEQVTSTIQSAEQLLPSELASLVNSQLKATAGQQTTNLLTAILAIALALYSASGGVQNLMKALNEAYDVDETRGFVKLKLISIGLVLGGIILGMPLLFLLVVQGDWLTGLGAPGWLATTFVIFRWVIVAAVMVVALAAMYRYGPDQPGAKWRWVSWGAVAAIILWMAGSLLFFFYAQNFANFSGDYGVFAGIIVLMTWFNLSALIFLLGAQVNSRLEARTYFSTRTH
jgi:membrane protein